MKLSQSLVGFSQISAGHTRPKWTNFLPTRRWDKTTPSDPMLVTLNSLRVIFEILGGFCPL